MGEVIYLDPGRRTDRTPGYEQNSHGAVPRQNWITGGLANVVLGISAAFERPRFWTHTAAPLVLAVTALGVVTSLDETPKGEGTCHTLVVNDSTMGNELREAFGPNDVSAGKIRDAVDRYWSTQNPNHSDLYREVAACISGSGGITVANTNATAPASRR